jgi:hypothetical protein
MHVLRLTRFGDSTLIPARNALAIIAYDELGLNQLPVAQNAQKLLLFVSRFRMTPVKCSQGAGCSIQWYD